MKVAAFPLTQLFYKRNPNSDLWIATYFTYLIQSEVTYAALRK